MARPAYLERVAHCYRTDRLFLLKKLPHHSRAGHHEKTNDGTHETKPPELQRWRMGPNSKTGILQIEWRENVCRLTRSQSRCESVMNAPLGCLYRMQTVTETPTFLVKPIDKLFSEEERCP